MEKYKVMLTKETKFGMTVSQIISAATLAILIVTVWIAISTRIAEAEVRIANLEKQRMEDVRIKEVDRIENKQDHQRILDKLDYLVEKISLNK